MQVFGYELLFRNGWTALAEIADPEAASRMTMDTTLSIGMDTLCDGRRAFVNCTRDVLESDSIRVLPPNSTVVEILEDVPASSPVLAKCAELRSLGYMIALDDVVSATRIEPFLRLVDILKVDFRKTSPACQRDLARKYAIRGTRMLAEKVETREEHLAARKMGYHFFQGFFFQKPQVLGTREIAALRVNYMRLLAAVQERELNFRALEEIIKSEPSLCYRLLRYLNSPLFTFTSRVTSIRHALSLVGEEEIRKWISVAALVSVGVDKPADLVMWALVRARFCEMLGARSMGREAGMFFLGLVSALPVLLDLPLDFIITRLPIAPEIQAALLGGRNHYRHAYDLVLAYESGRWEACAAVAKTMAMSEAQVTHCYLQSLEWARRLTHLESGIGTVPASAQQNGRAEARPC